MKIRWHKWIRKAHRWLGLLIGIQFLAWTVGGLYFSWTDLDAIHGSDWLGPAPQLADGFEAASIDGAIEALAAEGLVVLDRVELLPLSETSAVYRVSYRDSKGERSARLVDATTGKLRESLSLASSKELAIARYAGPEPAEVATVETLESTGPKDEYRELPLPAYAFTFDDARSTTIYVAPAHARITAIRNNQWRVFDFLWMLHTMDYQGRDNFNHLLLQAFAGFGLLTLFSGFALFFVSLRWR